MTKNLNTLKHKATLVMVNCKVWTAHKFDRKITRETNQRYKAEDDAGRWNKKLIGGKHLKKITDLQAAARTCLYHYSKPWAQEGPRILPNSLYQKFADEFRVIKRDFDQAADEFCRVYPKLVEDRKAKGNGMFRPEDYPSPSEIRSKFSLKFDMMNIPDDADFRSDLDDGLHEEIRHEIEANIQNSIKGAQDHTIHQVIEVVGHMVKKLNEVKDQPEPPKGKKRKSYKDSLVNNIRELVELMPAFNMTNDPALTALTDRIAKELCTEDAKDLRKHPEAAETVAKSAEDIMAVAEKFLM